jgi:hypothetical protein
MSEIDSKVKKFDHKTTVNSTLNILSVEFYLLIRHKITIFVETLVPQARVRSWLHFVSSYCIADTARCVPIQLTWMSCANLMR